ncbi:MAG: energy transducer TonB [Thermoanaerobaculia bacterium]|jgi:TonB family protein
MTPKKDDIRRRLGLREVPKPPDDLLRQLKADIPPSFRYPKHLTSDRRNDPTSAFRGMSWQVAASFLVLTLAGVGVYMVTFETQNQQTAKIAETDRAPEREFSPPMSPSAAAPAEKAAAGKTKGQADSQALGFSYEIPPPPPPPAPRQTRADAEIADGVEGGVAGGIPGGVYGGAASGVVQAVEEAPANAAATASADDTPRKQAAETQIATGRDDRYAEEKDSAAGAPVPMPAAAPMARAAQDEKVNGVHREPSPAISETTGRDLDSLRAKAATGEPLRVGGLVKAPVIIERVEIAYPKRAREVGIQGVVIVEAVIGRDGRVKSVRVLKTLPLGLEEAAVAAVKQWTFKPATLEGKPVDVLYTLAVNAKLAK